MDIMYLMIFIICLLSTIVGSTIGIGGSIIIKSVIDALGLFDVSVLRTMTSCIVFTMALTSSIKNAMVKIQPQRNLELIFSGGAIIGGISGKLAFNMCLILANDEKMIRFAQQIVCLIMLLLILFYLTYKHNIQTRKIQHLPIIVALGFILGLTSSFIGIGGGLMNLVCLYYCFSLDSKDAAIVSKRIIVLTHAPGLMIEFIDGSILSQNSIILGIMIVGASAGGGLGSILSHKLPNVVLDKMVILVTLVVIGITAYSIYRLI